MRLTPFFSIAGTRALTESEIRVTGDTTFAKGLSDVLFIFNDTTTASIPFSRFWMKFSSVAEPSI
jgi:hypothetical protein